MSSPAPPAEEEEEPTQGGRLALSRRNALVVGAFSIAALVALYFLLPQIAGLDETWDRIENGDPYWLLWAAVFTTGSFVGYVGLFRGVFVRASANLDWRESYEITMAGLAATRLMGAGGAGGIALTAWALRRSGMARREVADKSISFLVLTYLVYMAALIVFGFGLRAGVFSGPDPVGMTIVPAVFGLVVIAAVLALALVPPDLERRVQRLCERGDRIGCWAERPAHVPSAVSAGVRDAAGHLRSLDPALLGSVAFWGFQVAVLWAAFRAFGDSPSVAVLVMGFFVGMLGNLLPTPGGVGGVEAGMIGAFAALDVDAGHAVVAVLVYRAFVFWLPTIPGTIAYFQLRKTVRRWSVERAAT